MTNQPADRHGPESIGAENVRQGRIVGGYRWVVLALIAIAAIVGLIFSFV